MERSGLIFALRDEKDQSHRQMIYYDLLIIR